MKAIFILVSIISNFCFAFSQEQDSLYLLYKNEIDLNKKAKLGYELCEQNINQDLEFSLKICSEIMMLKDEGISSELLFDFNNILGIAYRNKHSLDSSDYFFNQAKIIGDQEQDQILQFIAMHNLALNSRMKGKYEDAISVFLRSLNIVEKLDNPNYKSAVFTDLGGTYLLIENWKLGRKYLRAALSINLELGDPDLIGTSYSSLSYSFDGPENLDSAIYYNEKAIEYLEKSNNLFALADAKNSRCVNISVQKKFQEACDCYLEVLDLYNSLEHLQGIMVANDNIGTAYTNLKKYHESIPYHLRAIELSNIANEKRIREIAHYSVSISYYNIGEYEKAYLHADTARTLLDSLRGPDIQDKLSELIVKYETAQKEQAFQQEKLEKERAEKEAVISDLENARLKAWIFGIGAFAILVALFSILLFYSNKRKSEQRKREQEIKTEQDKLASFLNGQEEERARISQDLHDGIGQQLTLLKTGINQLIQNQADSSAKSEWQDLETQVSQSAEEIRSISHQMMPVVLQKFGLRAGLESIAHQLNKLDKLNCSLQTSSLKNRYNNVIEVQLFRICQELTNNSIKHAQAKHINIQLKEKDGQLILRYQDDGVGVDTNEKGHGMNSIRTRLGVINGTMKWNSENNEGILVSIRVPLTD